VDPHARSRSPAWGAAPARYLLPPTAYYSRAWFDEELETHRRAKALDEDIHACDQVQAAVESLVFAVSPLAERHERPITNFRSHLLAATGTR
jgi:hypothetical protein